VNKLPCSLVEKAAVLCVEEAGSSETLTTINRTTRHYIPQKPVFLIIYFGVSKIQNAKCDGQLGIKRVTFFSQVLLRYTFYFLVLSVLLKILTCSKF
jgi:hypothetical protein